MSIRYNDYDAESERGAAEADGGPAEREISLGTTTVLGIFLGLAVVCAVFFGFGYSMGRKSVPSPLADVSTGVSAPLPENRLTPGSLPGAGSAGGAYTPPTVRSGAAEGTAADGSATRATPAAHGKPGAGDSPSSVADAQRRQVARAVDQANGIAPAPKVYVPQATPTQAAPAPATAPAAGAGNTYVQVTAISVAHRADADMLVASLRKKGYAAAIHAGGADGLLHVQLGPFATKKDAEAVRHQLSGDGYNSILK